MHTPVERWPRLGRGHGADHVPQLRLRRRRLRDHFAERREHPARRRRTASEAARLTINAWRCASGFRPWRIFHSCEVDILPDGRAGFPLDRVLSLSPEHVRPRARVAARVEVGHDRPNRCSEKLLCEDEASARVRSSRASDEPHAAAPARLRTPGTTSDSSRLPSNTGTFMEIDGAPSHLDMDGALAQTRDLAAGVEPVTDRQADSHRAEMLGAPDGARRGFPPRAADGSNRSTS